MNELHSDTMLNLDKTNIRIEIDAGGLINVLILTSGKSSKSLDKKAWYWKPVLHTYSSEEVAEYVKNSQELRREG